MKVIIKKVKKMKLFLDQHLVPDNVAINAGTTVLWSNGDVGHERTVDVKGA
ncbi:hypothetical protein NMY3_02853 [Candidatus Nitrosocosmicus oleophilus]|uniref:Uncharacterized protein n=1 Tax=Candidatus Nitrosocosmicus oleophilus TaxID=1353260 RepID=A0A654MC45_9ARCH|nr:hypothetical protein NMY3_02853 [Candidatus Nitrosocosmicus oleophilus]